jgi:hypothetical protein
MPISGISNLLNPHPWGINTPLLMCKNNWVLFCEITVIWVLEEEPSLEEDCF